MILPCSLIGLLLPMTLWPFSLLDGAAARNLYDKIDGRN